jgi:glycosyltransferase involved in cell wall biosynthesis
MTVAQATGPKPGTDPAGRPIRVGFVVHAMQVAGAEALVRETVRRLGPAIVPTVFCLDTVGAIGEELRAGGVDLVCLGRRQGWDFAVSRRLAAAATERRIEVLHAQRYTPFIYAALAKYLTRPAPRLILTEHGRHYPDRVSPARRAFNRAVLDRLADAVNACSHSSARALCRVEGFAGHRIEVIENGIVVERYGPAADRKALRKRLGLDPDRRSVVHVARHHPVKDQPTLLRGFARVAAEFPDADLLMIGDGPLRGDLEKLADELRIGDRVRFVGLQANVPDWLAASDVFALTSLSEVASLTLLEAMATGLPVAVTDVGGNPEIVRHGREGLLFSRGDSEALAESLRELLDDPEYAADLGAAARERVENRYRLGRTVGAYHRLYRRLAGR